MQNLKKRICDGEVVIGAAIPVNTSPETLRRIVDSGPYDYVSVDSQHSPYDENELATFCETAQDLEIPVQFRIKHTRHTYLVGNYLDLGPSGIEVPQVDTEATAEEAVQNFYYPQTGIRSWGGGSRLGFSGSEDRLEYANWWAATGVLWLQIESVEAVTKARRLALRGVDCLSFGPADLSFSLEAHPEHPFKTVDDCVQHVVDQLTDSSTAVCFRHYTRNLRQKYIDMGVTVLLERPE